MTDFDPANPGHYGFWTDDLVRYADIDMMGHVNNKSYATYIETARFAYFLARGLGDGPSGGMAVVRLELDFRKELRYPAILRIGVKPTRLGQSSLTLASAVFHGDICVATSLVVSVRLDMATHRSTPFTDEERMKLEADL